MKSVKMMLLGIALLIIASYGVPIWMVGQGVGAVVFFVGLSIGSILCIKGFFTKEQ